MSQSSVILGIRKNNTCFAYGGGVGYGEINVQDWTDIIQISNDNAHTLGLKSDGTCVAVGNNKNGECNVSDWKDIVQVAAGNGYSVGLKKDGTCVATGYNRYKECNVYSWSDIVKIAASDHYTLGLKSDGTCVGTGQTKYNNMNPTDWKDIISISMGTYHGIGLRSNGTAIANGANRQGQCNILYGNIKEILAIGLYTAILFDNGTVKLVGGYNSISTYANVDAEIAKWKNVKHIYGNKFNIIGIQEDGNILAYGEHADTFKANEKSILAFAEEPPVFIYNLLQYRTKYYNLDSNLYDKDNKIYLPCCSTLSIDNIKQYGFNSILNLFKDTSIGEETFKPINKFNKFKICRYQP